MDNGIDVIVVGAGPYGLSLAAHLLHRGVDTRIFGVPMQTWATAMPARMLLKSDGFASSLSTPQPGWSLGDYCRRRGLPYHDTDVPVPLETFVEYGLDFQRRFVPDLDQHQVSAIKRHGSGFLVQSDDGREWSARHVVVATGITHFAVLPQIFASCPGTHVTHSSAHRSFEEFAGRHVTVVGAGSSAVEVAVALATATAHVRLVARASRVRFGASPAGRPLTRLDRIRRPSSGLGPGWASRLSCDAPDLFRFVPGRYRPDIVKRHLGPLSPSHLREPFERSVEVEIGRTVEHVGIDGEDITLRLRDSLTGESSTFETQHVICATGYRADISRLPFLEPALVREVKTLAKYPVLSHGFQSSVEGLSFVGLAAAASFGPLMRFMFGDEFAARRISARLVKR